MDVLERENRLLAEFQKLRDINVLSKEKPEDYFDPNLMGYLDQYDFQYDENTKTYIAKFEVMGTRYEQRTDIIENLKLDTNLNVIRDEDNPYNSNNFKFEIEDGRNVGNMPADFCNVIAPLYDENLLNICSCRVCFTDPISKRSRYAKKGVLFVELIFKMNI